MTEYGTKLLRFILRNGDGVAVDSTMSRTHDIWNLSLLFGGSPANFQIKSGNAAMETASLFFYVRILSSESPA